MRTIAWVLIPGGLGIGFMFLGLLASKPVSNPLVAITAAILNTEKVKPGWYDWADAEDLPNFPAIFAQNHIYTSARCICGDDFDAVYSPDRSTFIVVQVEKGYSDTIGHRFKAKPRVCLNCSD